MKFDVSKVVSGCRLGCLSDFAQCVEKNIETPTAMIYTRAGSVPMLSRDMLDRLQNLPGLFQLPLTLLAEHQEALGLYKKGIKSFAGLEGHIVTSCVQDPTQAVPSGYNEKAFTSVWTKGGRLKLDVGGFMSLQESLGADVYEVMADDDTPPDATNKRLQKSFDRSMNFLDACLKHHHTSQRLQKSAILGVVGGGYSEEMREKQAKEVAKRPVQGFVVGGLHRFGPETEKFEMKEVKNLLQKTMSCLPEDKPRFLHGILRPHNVLEALEAGIDVIDTSYAYTAMERGNALTFRYHLPPKGSEVEQETDEAPTGYEISLKDKQYFDDFGPIVAGCTCYTCTTHSRAYINHLLSTQELLAGILLIMHNLHHFCHFVSEIRSSLHSDRYPQFRRLIMAQNDGKFHSPSAQGDGKFQAEKTQAGKRYNSEML